LEFLIELPRKKSEGPKSMELAYRALDDEVAKTVKPNCDGKEPWLASTYEATYAFKRKNTTRTWERRGIGGKLYDAMEASSKGLHIRRIILSERSEAKAIRSGNVTITKQGGDHLAPRGKSLKTPARFRKKTGKKPTPERKNDKGNIDLKGLGCSRSQRRAL